jgi:1-deoxy-D-xylulose-5-phosphate reductoisomerase
MGYQKVKNVAVLGSTGSIGCNTLKVIEAFPERFRLVAVSSFSNIDILERQIKKFKPSIAAVVDTDKVKELKKSLSGRSTKILTTSEGLNIIAQSKHVDIVVIAIAGSAAINPLICAIQSGKHICLANKESLVAAGSIIMPMVRKGAVKMIPIDSEHSAIFQCLCSGREKEIKQLFLTGSGGPLHNVDSRSFSGLGIGRALKHPKWKMGKKITIDSATLMNKGLEIIEAHHLFGIPVDMIKLIIHPEAIIHSMCEFRDGSIIAQLGITDMKLPIQYALTYPERFQTPFRSLDFSTVKSMEFRLPDILKYPCLSLAMAAAKLGGTATAALNAGNEIAVQAFLSRKIIFTKIPEIIEKVLIGHHFIESPTLDEILQTDAWAREKAALLI